MANEFFTLATLGTLAGATGATVAATNGIRTAFNANPRWLGLLISQVVCSGVLLASGPTNTSDWFIGVLNGFLIFATSAGTTAMGAAAAGNATGVHGAAARSGNVTGDSTSAQVARPPFWSSWF